MSTKNFTRRQALHAISLAFLGTQFSCTSTGSRETAKYPVQSTHYLTLHEVAALIKRGAISSKELTKEILDRIARLDGHLNSYITIMADTAMAAADQMDKELLEGKYRGPLHGIPIGVKDLLYTTNAPTTGSHAFNLKFIAPFNATVIDKLEAAGAIIIGKLNLTEGALGGYNSTWRIPKNPWGDDLFTGMSSSGSGVATAAGLCFASIGTDTGGSIRYPSCANGIVGLKPTYGLVSRYGVMPLSESLDHVGPMTRSTLDAAIMLEVIGGHDANDPTSINSQPLDLTSSIDKGIKGLRIGVDDYLKMGATPQVAAAVEDAVRQLELLGAVVVPIKWPDNKSDRDRHWFTICSKEAFEANRKTFPSRKSEYGDYFADALEAGSKVSEADYRAALKFKSEFAVSFRKLLAEVDAVAAPGGGIAKGVSDELWRKKHSEGVLGTFGHLLGMHFCNPSNLAGTPTLSLPCGKAANGLPPPGFQLIGNALTEATLCRIGYAYEQATSWNNQHPDLS